MKKLLLLAAVSIVLGGCTPRNGFVITGNVEGLEGMVYLLTFKGEKLDSAAIKNGAFRFSGRTGDNSILLLADGQEPFAMVFIESGRIKVAGDLTEDGRINVTGTVSNDRCNEFSVIRNSVMDRYYSASTEEERQAAIEEDRVLSEEAIDANLDNLFGLYMLEEVSYSWDPARVLAKLGEFTEKIRDTEMAGAIAERAEAQKRTEIGQPFIEIILPDRDGVQVALSSLIGPGRYVLVDFWASWCRPCMQEIPFLVDAYKKYSKKGFDIFGVSLDQDRNDWISAVDGNNMHWIHVSTIEVEDSTAAKDYSVYSIPSNFLIGPDGTIIAKNLRGEDVMGKLTELLGK